MTNMKKLFCVLLAAFVFAACDPTYKTVEGVSPAENSENATSMFVVIETTAHWTIVYHRDTKVMYSVQRGGESSGLMLPLYNRDGSLMTYKN